MKPTHVGFRAHVKIASRIVSYVTGPHRRLDNTESDGSRDSARSIRTLLYLRHCDHTTFHPAEIQRLRPAGLSHQLTRRRRHQLHRYRMGQHKRWTKRNFSRLAATMYNFAKISQRTFYLRKLSLNILRHLGKMSCHVSVILLSVLLRFCVLYHLQVIAENFNVFLHEASEFSATVI